MSKQTVLSWLLRGLPTLKPWTKLFSIDDPGFGNFAVDKVRSDTELIMQDLLLKLL